jgi:hypothetical protein
VCFTDALGWVSGTMFDTTSSMPREGVVGLHTLFERDPSARSFALSAGGPPMRTTRTRQPRTRRGAAAAGVALWPAPERLFPALLRIVELHCGRFERLRVEVAAGPPKRRLVLLMIGIGDDLQEFGIAADTTTVLRQAPTFAGDTTRVLVAVVAWLEALMHESWSMQTWATSVNSSN